MTQDNSHNPIIVALRVVFGPLVNQSKNWPPVLAYGLPGIVAVLMIIILRPVVPDNLIWLLALAVIAPLVGYIVSDVAARRHVDPGPDQGEGGGQSPAAMFYYPQPYQMVDRTIDCRGSATGIPPANHLWLAVLADRLIWPKEGEVLVDKNSRTWAHAIFEHGATKKFAIVLMMANPKAHEFILDWHEEGRRKGEYQELKGIPGTQTLQVVEGLRLKKRAQ